MNCKNLPMHSFVKEYTCELEETVTAEDTTEKLMFEHFDDFSV